MSANSIPTAPAPMMIIDLGACSRRTAPLEEMTDCSSIATPGRDLGSVPRLDGLRPARGGDLHQRQALEPSAPGVEGDLVLPEKEFDPLGHPIGDLAAPPARPRV